MGRLNYACLEVDGFDAETLLGVVNRARFEQRLLSSGHFRARAQRIEFPGFSLDCGTYTLPVFANGYFGENVVGLAITLRGDARVWLNGTHAHVGQLILFSEGRELSVRPIADMWQWVVLLVSREFLQQAALARYGRELDMPSEGWRLCARVAGDNFHLRRAIHRAFRVAGSWTSQTSQQEITALGRKILNGFVDVAMQSTAPRSVLRMRQREALLRRAEMFLLSCEDGKFSSAALSAELGRSERQVERLFQEAYRMSPLRWQLTARLNKARIALQKEAGLSVTEAALRAGFTHFGRFAQEYGRLFGELPRQTRMLQDAGAC